MPLFWHDYFSGRELLDRYVTPADRSTSAEMLGNRIRKNQKRLRKWQAREQVTCYRTYDRDLPEYALAVDLYQTAEGKHIRAQEYEAPSSIPPRIARNRFEEALSVLQDEFNIERNKISVRTRRRQRGPNQYEKLGNHQAFSRIEEGGHQFLVNFADYLDTGIFLDHRLTRAYIQSISRNARFLNLFCYTGTATVYAAKGGAHSTCSIDMSRTYTDWTRKNLELNQLNKQKNAIVQANCLDWLHESKGTKSFDLIFLDPPSYSSSKRMDSAFDVQRDHPDVINACINLLSKDGRLIFSTNKRNFRLNETLHSKMQIRSLTTATIPEDFKQGKPPHHCWEITDPEVFR